MIMIFTVDAASGHVDLTSYAELVLEKNPHKHNKLKGVFSFRLSHVMVHSFNSMNNIP